MKLSRYSIYAICAAAFLAAVTACNNNDKSSSEQHDSDSISVTAQENTIDLPAKYADKVKMENNRIISTNDKGTIIDFQATWCNPCQEMAPIFEEFAKTYGNYLNFISIDVDQYKQLAMQYEVTSIPCLVFVDADGSEISRQVGSISSEALAEIINKVFPETLP